MKNRKKGLIIKKLLGTKKSIYPVVPLRNIIVFPDMTMPLFIGRSTTLKTVEKSLSTNSLLVVVAQKTSNIEKPTSKDIYQIGTLGKILQVMRLPNGNIKVLFEASERVKLSNFTNQKGSFQAEIKILNSIEKMDAKSKELRRGILQHLPQYLGRKTKTREILELLEKLKTQPSHFCDFLISILNIDFEKRQEMLAELNVRKRLETVFDCLAKEEENHNIDFKIKERMQNQVNKNHKEHYLNEQMKAIKKELGEEDKNEMDKYKKKIKEAQLPKKVQEVVDEELKKIASIHPFSAESNIVRNYVEWILQIPWHAKTKDTYNLKNAEKILNLRHYGLEKVKERIIEFVAVTKMVGKLRGPLLCLVGPPGVGKSSLAKAVAETLNRKFARISLGGIRDEAEIRGHRRTYIGAMPGKIIQTMKKTGTKNPLILLDEVDKMSTNYMGDPAAALLEVLDPEQNNSFMDHYLDLEYDLSEVLFLCTANDIQNIPLPLQDRMEVIHLSGYTELEKKQIFQKHLLMRQLKESGLNKKQVSFEKNAILEIIQKYTKEAGIRELERCLAKICRKIVKNIIEEKQIKDKVVVNSKKVREFLGVDKYQFGKKNLKSLVGVATGLAWTVYGGDLLDIEVSCMKGKANIYLTGKLGEVMQESAKAALSFVKTNANNLGIYSDIFQGLDIHVHVPEGAIPKDGPSAGITLTSALVSNLTGIPIRHNIAMTGEISLHGRVLEIGGLKEKLLAAKRSGIREVVVPIGNQKHLEEIPEKILEGMKIHLVETIWTVLKIVLLRMPQIVNDSDITGEDKEKEISNVLKKSSLLELESLPEEKL